MSHSGTRANLVSGVCALDVCSRVLIPVQVPLARAAGGYGGAGRDDAAPAGASVPPPPSFGARSFDAPRERSYGAPPPGPGRPSDRMGMGRPMGRPMGRDPNAHRSRRRPVLDTNDKNAGHGGFFPAELMAIFTINMEIPNTAPVKRPRKASAPRMSGVAAFIEHFEDEMCIDRPPIESTAARRKRVHEEKLAAGKAAAARAVAEWDPKSDLKATADPFRTLFLARLSRSTTDYSLAEAFERFGSVRQARVVCDSAGRPRGYGFVLMKTADDFRAAYKRCADGVTIDGKRVLVDYERGRVRDDWRPRRLGGGRGDTRKTKVKKAAAAPLSAPPPRPLPPPRRDFR
jgi:hypothetical protein